MDPKKNTNVNVRGIEFQLMTYTNSLELCARMNYEVENLDFIDMMSPDDVMYDLGACEGRFSIYAAKKGIHVVAFEPERKNYSVLNQNLELNNLDSTVIKTINAGIGAKNGKAIMKIGQPWEGGHQKVVDHNDVREDLNFNFVEEQVVDILSLDSYISEGKSVHPNYLKVDVDGSEMPFLKGAKDTLRNTKLKGIIFELCENDSNFSEIINILSSHGFSEDRRVNVPNEPGLYNIIWSRRN